MNGLTESKGQPENIVARRSESIVVAYIVSQAHSGSTLLSQMIGSHSSAITIGEIKSTEELFTPCSCRCPKVIECEFWKRVDGKLAENGNRRLFELDFASQIGVRLAEDTSSLYRAVSEVANATLVVDSSKSISRLKLLTGRMECQLMPIFLRREPAGVVNSQIRKGRSWFKTVLRHYWGTRICIEYFRTVKHISVDYTLFARDPAGQLRRIMPAFGLNFEESQMKWAEKPNHAVNGNRMRFSRDSTVRPDDAWRKELTLVQMLVIRLLTNNWVLENDLIAGIARLYRRAFRGDSSDQRLAE